MDIVKNNLGRLTNHILSINRKAKTIIVVLKTINKQISDYSLRKSTKVINGGLE